jgi:hypothetical protein
MLSSHMQVGLVLLFVNHRSGVEAAAACEILPFEHRLTLTLISLALGTTPSWDTCARSQLRGEWLEIRMI